VHLPGRHHRLRARLALFSVVLTAIACAALMTAAALVPAPPAALAFVVLACVACPMAASFELARALAALREPYAALRRELDRLPETPHPLGY
jgi:hypothetical protein